MPLGALLGGIISAYNPVYVFALAAFTKLLEVLLYYVVDTKAMIEGKIIMYDWLIKIYG